MLQQTDEVVIIAEAAETAEMTETATNKVQQGEIPMRRKKRFESDCFLLYMSRKAKVSGIKETRVQNNLGNMWFY